MTTTVKKTYFELVKEAILALKDRTGSSAQAIKGFITEHNPKLDFQQVSLILHFSSLLRILTLSFLVLAPPTKCLEQRCGPDAGLGMDLFQHLVNIGGVGLGSLCRSSLAGLGDLLGGGLHGFLSNGSGCLFSHFLVCFVIGFSTFKKPRARPNWVRSLNAS